MTTKPEYGVLTYINTSEISPHPENPRKSLGDLSELAESIKVNGVLQNLTVVPRYGELTHDFNGYTVVIGHRRLAAAKLAGIATVPCIVSDMTGVKQIRTMLTENMQRSDLSVYEQAQGFQLMLDLGDSVSDISERTGFSSTTVRRRVKLLELDQEKFKKSEKRGATLMDYAELEKIESIELRNKVLESIGTQNFRNELKAAMDREKLDSYMEDAVSILETFAERIEESDYKTMSYQGNYGYWNIGKEIVVPDDAQTARYYFKSSARQIDVYRDKADDPIDETAEKRKEEQAKRQAKVDQFKEIAARCSTLRFEFIRSFSNAQAKKNLPAIIEYAVCAALEDGYTRFGFAEFAELLNIEGDTDSGEWEFSDIVPQLREKPELYLLVSTFESLETNQDYYNWRSEYTPCDELDRLYDFMISLGYEMSDEEKAMQNGTHELFKKVEEA